MGDGERQCTAKSKQSGKRCKRPAAPGKRVCYMHGANAGPPKGNLNAMIHGAYVDRILTDEEQRLYDSFIKQIHEDFAFNSSSDEVAVLMAAMSFVQFCRAQQAGKEDAAEKQARIIRNMLKDLKATKLSREGETVNLATTPAEWAAALLAQTQGTQSDDEKPKKDRPRAKTKK